MEVTISKFHTPVSILLRAKECFHVHSDQFIEVRKIDFCDGKQFAGGFIHAGDSTYAMN